MLLIATGLHSRALAVLSCVRDSEVFGEFPYLSTRYGFGFVMALSCCWGMDLAMGQWKLTHTGLPAAGPGLACAQGCLVQASNCLWRRTLLTDTDSDIGFLTRW